MFEFDRSQGGERAVLVQLGGSIDDENLAEFTALTESTGAKIVDVVHGAKRKLNPKYFVGTGKAEEIRCCVQAANADVVLFNHELSPAQERNLEQLISCRVLDRTTLILDIFAQRAQSFEGKLQVELAQLRHLSTRLVRGWTHLERQKGGIGLRGPGETQLESDRRLIGDRIKQLKKRLAKVQKQRDQQRRARQRANTKTVSLVGYTNAGKSTLFNRLTGADAYAADQLFATLDPTLRRLKVAGQLNIVMADTVGFISRLPHGLVAAFRATLDETRDADLLLHVVDAHQPERDEHIAQVNKVLTEIGANNVPQIEVYNKTDLLPDETARIDKNSDGVVNRVWLSAASGKGVAPLQQALVDYFLYLPEHE